MAEKSARRAAFDILLRIERDRAYAGVLLDAELSRGDLRPADRPFLTELVYGICRRRGTLDHIARQFCDRNPEKLERAVQILLRLGLYQLFFLEKVPVSAAVNETVEMAKHHAPRAAGFLNAVLRSADRNREHVRYPSPEKDPAGYIAARHSQPRWIVERWIAQLGLEEAEALAVAMGEPAPLTLRSNTLRCSREDLLHRLHEQGIAATGTRYSPLGFRLPGSGAVSSLPGFAEGCATVQDESSQLAVLFLDPQPGERILDCCSAPGGKAAFCAQLMQNKGEVAAGEANPRKIQLVEETAQRLGADIIRPLRFDAKAPPQEFGQAFHRVLVDAPCSGLGVLRRNPEGKWWKKEEEIAEHAEIQRAILEGGASCLSPGGILLYSTCSTAPEEDEEIVFDFLSHTPGFVVEDLRELFPGWDELFTSDGFFRSWPHRHGMDGFFAARLRRVE